MKYLNFDNQSPWNVYSWPLALFQHISVFPLFYYNHLSSSSLGTVFMATREYLERLFIALCLEGFFYGKISVPCALTCTLVNSNYSGLYFGIFVMYLHCSSNNLKSGTATILSYALYLLYVLSTATIVSDLVALMLTVSNNPICKYIIFHQLCSGLLIHYRLNFKLTHC